MKLNLDKEWFVNAAKLEAELEETPGQRELRAKHGTPAEFAKSVYDAVPEFISMDEARLSIEKYSKEWNEA